MPPSLLSSDRSHHHVTSSQASGYMPTQPTDQPIDIEQPAALLVYLHANGFIQPTERPQIDYLAGGVSNRTALVTRTSGEQWVIKQALEKLRVQVDWFSSPARIEREAAGLRWVAQAIPDHTPTLIHLDTATHILIMSAVPQPHENWKLLLLQGALDLNHVRQFAAQLSAIHRYGHMQRDYAHAEFADRKFFESLRIEPYYQYMAAQVPSAHAFIADLIDATRQRLHTVVHGDYSPKNVLVYQDRLILLDYEVIHWGDPAFDLGFALTHLLSKAHYLTAYRGQFVQAATVFWETYQAGVNDLPWFADLEGFAVRHTMACLLARVKGRSTLEYLNQAQRDRQLQVVTALIARPPATIAALIEAFVTALP